MAKKKRVTQKQRRKEHTGVRPYRNYKDRVFRMLFTDRNRLLELYNALNESNYTDTDALLVNTLENAIFIKMKNDVSFVIDCNMCLYEHQSTYCPNMPLRGFLYFADLYKKLMRNTDLSVSRLIKIPKPHYLVFYNGTERQEERFIQRLSDAFEDTGREKHVTGGCIELIVETLNINFGQNRELLDRSPSLYGYAYFVALVRENLQYMSLEKAAECAVDECIAANILKDFFLEQRSEVIAMSIYEYNEEAVRKILLEDGYLQGEKDGYQRGKREALAKAIDNIILHYHVELERACQNMGISVAEYEEIKNSGIESAKGGI